MKKYESGNAYRGKIPKNQAEKFALLWGEGSPNLENLIRYCILNDIKTVASCKGHKIGDSPYIMFQMNREFTESMLTQLDNFEIGRLSRFGDRLPELSLYANGINDSEVFFESILNSVENFVQKRDISKSVESPKIAEFVSEIYSKKGECQSIAFYKDGSIFEKTKLPEFIVDRHNKVKYAYSPLKRFCKSSKQTLSAILDKGKEFFDFVFAKRNMDITEEKGVEK